MMNDLQAWQPATQQTVFRQLMHAFSYPGRVNDVCTDEYALSRILATLLDGEVTLADPDALLDVSTLMRLEARTGSAEEAQFVVVRGDRAPRFLPALGTLESPEHGATVILVVARLGDGTELHLSGPGIDGATSLRVRGLNPAWLAARAGWNAHFPLGVDLILVDDQRVAALPRTTRIASEGEH